MDPAEFDVRDCDYIYLTLREHRALRRDILLRYGDSNCHCDRLQNLLNFVKKLIEDETNEDRDRLSILWSYRDLFYYGVQHYRTIIDRQVLEFSQLEEYMNWRYGTEPMDGETDPWYLTVPLSDEEEE